VTVAVTFGIFFVVENDKAFDERPFALHRQQPERDTVFIRLLAALEHRLLKPLRCFRELARFTFNWTSWL